MGVDSKGEYVFGLKEEELRGEEFLPTTVSSRTWLLGVMFITKGSVAAKDYKG